jgi:prepilin-type processing-associated H-X9-DG protein
MTAAAISSKKDLVVILVCILFSLTGIEAIGSGGRRRAKETVCLSNLRRWGVVFEMYTNDNDGYFFSGELNGTRAGAGAGRYWRLTLEPYFQDNNLLCCPEAAKRDRKQTLLCHTAWQVDGYPGSYGLNGWVLNIPASVQPQNRTNGWGRTPADWHWGTPYVKNTNEVPVSTGSWWVDSWPREADQPPPTEAGPADTPNTNEMNRVCVDRHNGFVNSLFCDWSARKVALKELWTLKWHCEYSTCGPWTKCGGVQPEDWPDWMRHFKDY